MTDRGASPGFGVEPVSGEASPTARAADPKGGAGGRVWLVHCRVICGVLRHLQPAGRFHPTLSPGPNQPRLLGLLRSNLRDWFVIPQGRRVSPSPSGCRRVTKQSGEPEAQCSTECRIALLHGGAPRPSPQRKKFTRSRLVSVEQVRLLKGRGITSAGFYDSDKVVGTPCKRSSAAAQ